MSPLFALIFTLQVFSSPYTVNIAGNVKNRLYSPDTNVNLGQYQDQKVNLSVEQPSPLQYTQEQPATQLVPQKYVQEQPIIQQYDQEYLASQPYSLSF
ncbi:hypothetical protein CONCODRAFT_4250 [Conidiobolus coronatus NRRL 28638]|uniref:Uncharacterized protein n=1 Tax=Conidiobolus coronatus (strain ATCC 28846 / CBS 209.66 / NRRL 28638) TaxID=796925 RepID=A0A137PD04_CONC2|nr:hypothetical protein CONCODRAFT_4250 [Conidiobolus coronatus NRRL 28638]|eukprot:KXN72855.1 hypothetical protein CONCODRAFT_4250 [Conidiobolus coronatus NRRL 28638]